MSWLFLLLIAAVLAAAVALTGAKPAEARPVAGTRLMRAGRWALAILAVIFLILAVRGYFAG